MGHRFTYVVSPEEERENLTVEWFLRRHGYSRHIITGLKRTEDGIFRNGVRAWTSQAVHAGDVIETHLVETEPSDGILPRPVPFSVVYEDDDILVVDKPADTPIHPSIGNYENTLANGIAWYYESQGIPFVFRCINRLDRDTTGLLILAKNMLSGAILSQQMKNREIHRTYLALVEGCLPPSGTIDAPIGRVGDSVIERCVDPEHGEPAITHYQRLAYYPGSSFQGSSSDPAVLSHGISLAELHLETGRTHQIRVHMTSIGHPLCGDTLYNPDTVHMNRQALHSHALEFVHPITGEPLQFRAPLPADMMAALPLLQFR